MKLSDKELADGLVAGSYLEESQAEEALKSAKAEKVSLYEYLIESNLLTNDLIGQGIAELYKIPYADLNSIVPSREQVLQIPENLAREKRLVVFKEDENSVTITSDQKDMKESEDMLKSLFPGKEINFAFSLSADIDNILLHYRKALETRFSKIIAQQKRVAPEIIDEILADAVNYKTSDIHFEPQEKEVVIRFRVDGVLQEAGRIPKEYYENIVNRLKIQANLRIDDHFSAQDGAIRFKHRERKIDARMSLVPTLDGETIVLRLLADYMKGFALSDLGLLEENRASLKESASRPFGMILVTGPTGSGKTTTLYAVLKSIYNPQINITTIEDPVEFKIQGTNQIQVNNQTGLTFAKGLRSIVRQDPDIVLVGEIRDKETAEISVNAALTGHLLLSTFHANDAATSIPRLIDMGIEPFLLASTLELVVAQRLVRTVCDSCRHSKRVSIEEIKKSFPEADSFFSQKETTLYEGKGCQSCSGTGYKGRIGVFEFINITSAMRDLILKNPSSQEIWRLARKEGSISLFEDGLKKVKSGKTTLEELIRIAEAPDEEELALSNNNEEAKKEDKKKKDDDKKKKTKKEKEKEEGNKKEEKKKK
ncbi:MAG: GspE/PulE family protein [Patescibacteria group bacterium]|jgi:type II secretory ATPase GspE/PulE/Tfp pilus assembly ATPase PilB-like protein|nr:GspE/PulE family protein [Patescibacteria group bacterium]